MGDTIISLSKSLVNQLASVLLGLRLSILCWHMLTLQFPGYSIRCLVASVGDKGCVSYQLLRSCRREVVCPSHEQSWCTPAAPLHANQCRAQSRHAWDSGKDAPSHLKSFRKQPRRAPYLEIWTILPLVRPWHVQQGLNCLSFCRVRRWQIWRCKQTSGQAHLVGRQPRRLWRTFPWRLGWTMSYTGGTWSTFSQAILPSPSKHTICRVSASWTPHNSQERLGPPSLAIMAQTPTWPCSKAPLYPRSASAALHYFISVAKPLPSMENSLHAKIDCSFLCSYVMYFVLCSFWVSPSSTTSPMSD